MRRLATSIVIVATVLGYAGAASAAKPVMTQTQTERGVTESLRERDPCLGVIDVTITYNSVFHITEFVSGPNEGNVHVTFTQAGKFIIDPLAAGVPTFTGTFAIWGGFNQNPRSSAETFTFNAVGRAADGTRVRLHAVEHLNVTPGGVEHLFSVESCTV